MTKSRQHLQGQPLLCTGSGLPPVSSTDSTREPEGSGKARGLHWSHMLIFFQIFLCTERDSWDRFKYLHGLFSFVPETHHPALVEIQPCTCVSCTRKVSTPPHGQPQLCPLQLSLRFRQLLVTKPIQCVLYTLVTFSITFFQAPTKKQL